MNFAETADHRELRSSLRSFLEQHAPMSAVRRVVDGAESYDPALWTRMSDDLDLQAMGIPVEYGGSGAPWSFQAVVLEELGRALTPTPYFSTVVLAANALIASQDEQACREVLPGIAAGETIATLAVAEARGAWDLEHLSTTATFDGQWRVSGEKSWVSDGNIADVALILASSDEGPCLLLLDLNAEGVSREELELLDATRPMSTLRCDKAAARLIGRPGDGRRAVEHTLAVAAIALACEQVGGAGRALEMAVDYAKTRVQFDRPIGSFQSIKHLLADRLVDNESASAATRYASQALDEAPEETLLLAHLCKSFASDAYLDAAAVNIQVHGGIGFTWEHDAHLYFKRATASRQWLGSSDFHRERLARLRIDEAASPRDPLSKP